MIHIVSGLNKIGISPAMKIRALIGVSLIAAYFVYVSEVSNSTFRVPAPKALDFENAVFRRSCYDYENLTALNRCCKMKHYNFSVAEACARGFTRSKSKRSQNPAHSNLTESLHIVLVGDSHLRYIFAALALRLANPRLLYRQREWQEWVDGRTGLVQLRSLGPKTLLEARHLDLDLRITYHTDLFLENLPSLMQRWEEGNETKPSIVFLDSGLHYMVYRPHPEALTYKESLVKVAPYLTQLASSVPVVYKLIDDLLAARKRTHKMSQSLTDLYNQIARQELQGTGVHIWDSTLPLSVLYNDACAEQKRNTPPLNEWYCSNTRHLGYIVVEQFADMIYNAVCNRYLDLPDKYCK